MLFNSIEFLFFFPTVTILYFLIPDKYRWLHLLIASCVFYAAFIPAYILILFLTIIIDYIAGIMIEKSAGRKRKLFLVMSIIANVGILAFFKYFNFFIDNINHLLPMFSTGAHNIPLLNIILPIGLSFHTFQAMSYTIEVYRGNQKAEKHFGIYALYVMFYPQLVAGPIERPQNMLHQFHEKHVFKYVHVTSGLKLMFWGLFKKVVIADRLAIITDPIFNHPHDFPAVTLLLAAFFFSFQIYCDFSGYSDIALGAARVMGFKLMTNFNHPYHSKSISEFWKRWHISLSTWFRDYLYISLGGNKVSVPRWYFNLFFVFLVSGFWHGANWTFIAWGALHGFYLIFDIVTKKFRHNVSVLAGLNKVPKVNTLLDMFITFTLVMAAWVFFRANTISDALYITGQLPYAAKDVVHFFKTHEIWVGKLYQFTTGKEIILSFALIAFLESVHFAEYKFDIGSFFMRQPIYIRWSVYYLSIGALIYLGVFVNRQFIYFQF